MKLHHFFRLALLVPWLFCFHPSSASLGGGSVMGRVMDPSSKTPVSDATVVFDCQGNQHVFSTNEKGYYYASNIPPGVYNITVVFLSKSTSIIGLKVSSDQTMEQNFELASAVEDTGVIVYAAHGRKPPLIDPFGDGEHVLTQTDIKEEPVTTIGQLIAQEAGVTEVNGSFYVHGARSDGMAYYIDGYRIMGTAVVPLNGLDTYKSYTGFIPVNYGDATGGVIVMETRSYFTEEH